MRAVRPPSLFPGASWISAAYDFGLRKGPALAFVVHMAESLDHTENYLTGAPARNVSVHFVVNRDGKLWQMLGLERASGSLNPADLRSGDDADHFYGRTAGVAVMDGWYGDPNSAAITVEMDGRAAIGITPAQVATLARLIANVRTAYPTVRGVLGHRDFTATKACPGKLIPWAQIGGHGLFTAVELPSSEADMAINTRGLTLASSHAITLPANTPIYKSPGPSPVLGRAAGEVLYFGSIGAWKAVRVNFGAGSLIAYTDTSASVVLVTVPVAPVVADTSPFSKADVDAKVQAAVDADRAKAHITWQA